MNILLYNETNRVEVPYFGIFEDSKLLKELSNHESSNTIKCYIQDLDCVAVNDIQTIFDTKLFNKDRLRATVKLADYLQMQKVLDYISLNYQNVDFDNSYISLRRYAEYLSLYQNAIKDFADFDSVMEILDDNRLNDINFRVTNITGTD